MNDSTIPRRWLPWMRVVWIAIAVTLTLLFGAGLAPRLAELRQTCSGTGCPPLTVTPLEAALLREWGGSIEMYALFQTAIEAVTYLLFGSLATLLFYRKSDDWLVMLVSVELWFIGVNFYPDATRALTRTYAQLEPLQAFLTSLTVVFFMLLFYLFPTGRFGPRWLGYVAGSISLIVVLDPFINQDGPQASSASIIVVIAAMVGAVLGLLSQVYRYVRVSTRLERQQTKWVVTGLLCMLAASFLWMIFVELAPLPAGKARLLFNLSIAPQYAVVSLFPISMVISILRYRLYDIDVLIRRTLVYAILTGALALVYFGGVVILQSIITEITGRTQTSQVSIVLSTLLIAALFAPLRRRIQGMIDRRFYRRKVDAGRALERFGEVARSEVKLAALQSAMVDAVQQTLQPEQVTLWLAGPAQAGNAKIKSL